MTTWFKRITDAILDKVRPPSAAPRGFVGSASDRPPPMPAPSPRHPYQSTVQRSGDPFDDPSTGVVGHYRSGRVFTFRGVGQ